MLGQNHNNSIGVMIPLFIGAESGSRIAKKLKIRLQIQGQNHYTSSLNLPPDQTLALFPILIPEGLARQA